MCFDEFVEIKPFKNNMAVLCRNPESNYVASEAWVYKGCPSESGASVHHSSLHRQQP